MFLTSVNNAQNGDALNIAGHVDGISRSRGWDKEIPHGVLPLEQLVLSDKWVRI